MNVCISLLFAFWVKQNTGSYGLVIHLNNLDINFTWAMPVSGRWRKYNKNVIIPYLLK